MATTLQYSHNDDNVAGNDPMEGAIQMNTSGDSEQEHSIFSFTIQDIMSLPAGSYKVVNGQLVPQ